MHPRSLFETILTESLAAQVSELDDTLRADTTPLHPADASDRLALLLGRVVRRAVDALRDDVRVSQGVALTRALVDMIARVEKELSNQRPVLEGRVLTSIAPVRPDGTVATIMAPLIPLLDTTLLTNAPREPRVGQQILTEVASADSIDVVMAFIRRSGINPLLDVLTRHCARAGCLPSATRCATSRLASCRSAV